MQCQSSRCEIEVFEDRAEALDLEKWGGAVLRSEKTLTFGKGEKGTSLTQSIELLELFMYRVIMNEGRESKNPKGMWAGIYG